MKISQEEKENSILNKTLENMLGYIYVWRTVNENEINKILVQKRKQRGKQKHNRKMNIESRATL
jgi:hypothetical protein